MDKLRLVLKFLQVNPKRFAVALSVLIAIVAAWESRNIFSVSSTSVKDLRVLVAMRDLDEGDLVTLSDLSTVPISRISLPDGMRAFTDQELFLVQGQRLIKSVKQGSPIISDLIESNSHGLKIPEIPSGRRAYFIETHSFEMVFPGSKVDLILKPLMDSKDSLILTENALVLSVERRQDLPGVVVALTPDEIEWVERNSRVGKIVLAVRNPKEKSTRRALKKAKRGRLKRVKVEVITEGT